MKTMMYKILSILVILISATSCVSVGEVNEINRRLETIWLLEYQKMENTDRSRVVESNVIYNFDNVKKTLNDINLAVINADFVNGKINARGISPAPLTQEQWQKVVEIENPRVRKISGGLLYMSEDPSNYIITVEILIRGNNKKSFVTLGYSLSAPKYEALGFQMPKVAPPAAALIGANNFWAALTERLRKISSPVPRRVLPGEAV